MLSNFDVGRLLDVFALIVPLLFAVTLHELAHGYVAYRQGDQTAKIAGRLTLNPIKHLDIIGSFLLPLALYLTGMPIFGYAKPVPVNFLHLRHINRDMRLISAAGVTANIVLAVLSAAAFRLLLYYQGSWSGTAVSPVLIILLDMIIYSVTINIILAFFNLLPVPPLDGSKILVTMLPDRLKLPYLRIERYGMIIIFLLLITGSLSRLFSFVIYPMVRLLLGR